MTIVQFPQVHVEDYVREDLGPVVRDAVSRMDRLISFYSEAGGRNPATILMMIAAILEEPEFRRATGIERRLEIRR